jgi:hypothetical protein
MLTSTQILAPRPIRVRSAAIFGREHTDSFLSAVGAMHRLIARTLLFALLAGMFSPLAAASSMSVSHPHCNRKPVSAPAEEMTGCHHHGAVAHATATPQNSEPTSPDRIQAPNDCCQDHECCRSMARSQWADSSLRASHSELNQAEQISSVIDSQIRAVEVVFTHSGRAPPAL